MYERSKSIKKPTHCDFAHLEQCSGKKFEVHHVDGDITNNTKENLLNVCTSHHRLIHAKRFDINNPKKMNFYVEPKSGKRRYTYE